MLAVPDASVHRTKLADWVELKAIASADRRVAFSTLVSASALAEENQEANIGDESTAEEGLVLCVQTEITRRLENIGNDYPFRIDDKGRALHFIAPLTAAGSVYLFCLFLSHAFDNTIVSEEMAPVVNNKIRDLFQSCATIAAGGYIQGPSMSFGFPRPDGSDFLKALRKVYRLFGDGRPCARPRKAAPPKVKDNGIDIIAWRWSIDRLPGMPYLIGQVASGKDWLDKSVKTDRELIVHAYDGLGMHFSSAQGEAPAEPRSRKKHGVIATPRLGRSFALSPIPNFRGEPKIENEE